MEYMYMSTALYLIYIQSEKYMYVYSPNSIVYSCYRIKEKILIITSDIMILYKNIWKLIEKITEL